MASNDQLRFGQAFPGYGVANRLNPSGDGRYIYPDWQNAPLSQADAPPVAPPPASYPTWLTDLGSRGIGGDWTPTQGPAPDRYQLVSDFEASRPKPPPAPVAQAQQPQAPEIPPGWDSAVQPSAHSSEAGSVGGGDASGGGGSDSEGGASGGGGDYYGGGGDYGGSGDYGDGGGTPGGSGDYYGGSGDYGDGGGTPGGSGDYYGGGGDYGDGGGTDSGADGPGGGGGTDGGGNGPEGGGDGGGGGEGNFRGGVITANKLVGPNPPGPDDGYASIKKGEGVLTVAAMQHYGPAFLARLNKLAVPKK